MPVRILIVEPSSQLVSMLARSLETGVADLCRSFNEARSRMFGNHYDRLITNLRLGSYNGLHLVHLAGPHTRSIVYTDRQDASFAREIQQAGAFYESADRLSFSIAAYVDGILPSTDRRDPCRPDRRATVRGGRRPSDGDSNALHADRQRLGMVLHSSLSDVI
jgi:DNA-binding NtrC family response regulator